MGEITKKQSQDYYDKEFIERQKKAGVNARHRSIFNKAKVLGLLPSHDVLEIGCGIGTLSSLLIPYLRGGSIFCCDLSLESITYARETYKKFTNAEFHALDATNFVLDRKFDMVIMPDVCEHIPIEHHNRMFKNISKMLKKDGIVYIHIPSPYYLDWARVYAKEELQLIDQSLYLDEFCERIKDTDFYVYSEEPYNVWTSPARFEWKWKYVHRVLRKKIDFTADTDSLPKISVIIPIYKTEPYLVKCLDSVCNQTYKHLEIIGVDDGSPDNSGLILDKYAEKDKRVIAVHKQNGGSASARNAGIDVATGEYLAFVDSDDWIERNMYEVLLNALKKHNADIASCFVCRDFPNSRQSRKSDNMRPPKGADIVFNSWQEMFIGYLDKSLRDTGYSVPHLYHKNIFSDMRFPQDIKIYEDTWFLLWRMMRCKRQVIVKEAYYHYFQSPSSHLRSEFGFHKLEIYKVFDYWLDVSNENNRIFDALLRVNIIRQITVLWFSPNAVCEEHINAIFKLLRKTYRIEANEEGEIVEMAEILQKISNDIALKHLKDLPDFIVDMVNIIIEKINKKEDISTLENVNYALQKLKSKHSKSFRIRKSSVKKAIKSILRSLKIFKR